MKNAIVWALSAAVLALATPAQAQNEDGVGTYGVLELRAGAYPTDPLEAEVVAGGSTDIAQTIGGLCTGWIAENPDLTVDYTMGDAELYISVESEADTTLAVLAPDGFYYCDDDSGGSEFNPGVYLPKPPAGRYQIWVGTFASDAGTPPATVYFSEIDYIEALRAPVQPENLAAPGAQPNYGSITLVSGFEPDPHTVSIRAGGGNAINEELPQCYGYISINPDFRLDWTAGDGSLPLIISAASDTDTTLLVRKPDGSFACDDDGGEQGANPSLRFDRPASGSYEVWVGTFSGDVGAPRAVLHISEISTQ